MIEHLEEYALGGGRYRQRYGAGETEEPRFALGGPDPDDEVIVSFGALSVPLKAAGKAAQRLSRQLEAVWGDALGGKTMTEPS